MKQRIIKTVLIAVAVVLITIGIAQGDHANTRFKAILICLECIGIG